MKITLKNLLVQLDRNDLNKLTKEVRETIYVDASAGSSTKSFTSAELGRIQSRKRVVLVGRRFL